MCRSVQSSLVSSLDTQSPVGGGGGGGGASPGTHFTKGLWIHHADLVKNYFALITMAMIEIRLQICACHNSSAVVTFTKLSMIWFVDVRATWMLIHPLWNGSRCTAAPRVRLHRCAVSIASHRGLSQQDLDKMVTKCFTTSPKNNIIIEYIYINSVIRYPSTFK